MKKGHEDKSVRILELFGKHRILTKLNQPKAMIKFDPIRYIIKESKGNVWEVIPPEVHKWSITVLLNLPDIAIIKICKNIYHIVSQSQILWEKNVKKSIIFRQ